MLCYATVQSRVDERRTKRRHALPEAGTSTSTGRPSRRGCRAPLRLVRRHVDTTRLPTKGLPPWKFRSNSAVMQLMILMTPALGTLSCWSGDSEAPTGTAQAALMAPTGVGIPPWESNLSWGKGGSLVEKCMASLVRKASYPEWSWALTSAHCFANINPISGTGNAFGFIFKAEDVFLHPDAYPHSGATTLADLPPESPPGLPNEWGDLALVRIPLSGTEDFQAIKLWYTADVQAAAQWLQGKALTFAGRLLTPEHPQEGEPVTGTALVERFDAYDLIASPDLSKLERGDSGGGAWLTLDASAPEPLLQFPSDCAIFPGAVGDTVLVGVNRAWAHPEDSWSPPHAELFLGVFPATIAEWVASVTQSDRDGDLVCDRRDNCLDTLNPAQTNSNRLAEDTWGGGIHLGDRCDPAPTPVPELRRSGFVRGEGTPAGGPDIHSKYLMTTTYGRDIYDQLAVDPVLANGSSLPDRTAQPFFCDCRDADLQPIEDDDLCARPDGPFRCIPDPRQADGDFAETIAAQASISNGTTAWHAMTVGSRDEPTKGGTYAVDYPGPPVTRQWLYELDYEEWVLDNGWMAPAAPSAGHGPGTDLGGALWTHTATVAGAEDHGLPFFECDPAVEICSIADGYRFGVSPDPRTIKTSASTMVWGSLPLCPPNCPWFTTGEEVIYPQPFVAVTPDASFALLHADNDGAREATQRLSPALRELLVRQDVLYAPASESATLRSDELLVDLPAGDGLAPGASTAFGAPNSPRALFLVPDEAGGVDLYALVYRTSGRFDVALVESAAGAISDELAALLTSPAARAHAAVVYSRVADALYVVSGGSEGTPGLPPRIYQRRRPRPGLTTPSWTVGPLSAGGPFGASPRAVFSPRDWRIWVVDANGPPGNLAWRLRRITPGNGEAVTDLPVPALGELEDVWLSTYDDGRVLLAGNRRMDAAAREGAHGLPQTARGKPERYVMALLSSVPFRNPTTLGVDAVLEGDGHLVTAPKVARGVVSAMVRHVPPVGDDALAPVAFTASDFTTSWPSLAYDFETP